jgi:hypothetical protein
MNAQKTTLTVALMAAGLPFWGCGPEPTIADDPIDTEVQATTLLGTVPAEQGTTDNTGVANWKVKHDKKKRITTVTALDKHAKTLATVTFGISKSGKIVNGISIKAKGFGEQVSCKLTETAGDISPAPGCNITSSGLLTEILGALRSDVEAFQTGEHDSEEGPTLAHGFLDCLASALSEVLVCSIAVEELGANGAANNVCLATVSATDAACDG